MNTNHPTLSADGLRFEDEFSHESRSDRQPEKIKSINIPSSSNGGRHSNSHIVEEMMILGR